MDGSPVCQTEQLRLAISLQLGKISLIPYQLLTLKQNAK